MVRSSLIANDDQTRMVDCVSLETGSAGCPYSERWENPGERWVCVCICICIFNCICICILVSICIWCGGLSILQHWKMLAKSGSVSVFVFEFTRVSIFRTLYGLAGCPYFGRWENPGERWVCLVKKYSGHSRKILAKGCLPPTRPQ